MNLQNEIEKLKRTRKRGPMSTSERLEAIQIAYKTGMRGADLNELDYSLMSPVEREESDRIWAEIKPRVAHPSPPLARVGILARTTKT